MRSALSSFPRAVASLAAAALLVAGLAVAGPQAPAVADTAPTDPGTPATVSSDSLPTVQVDGVVWSQIIVGNTVYVAGQFTTARPAGAAPGTLTVRRSNLLAYSLTTGALLTTWAPALNGPAYVITASPDKTRLYIGGNFTTVNGAAQARFVVLDRATGKRVDGFTVGANAAVRAIASTPSTIYLGGNFNAVAGATRYRLAALSATTGSLLSWAVSAQSAQVDALVLSPDQSRLIVGGRFTMLGGVAAPGSGAVSASTGAVLPWAANTVIKNWGYGAGITSLVTDGTLIYGSGFAFIRDTSSAGNLEGVFAADPMTGEIVWVEDCHGDTYSVFATPGKDTVYGAGHAHYCGNIAGYPNGAYRYGLAFSKKVAMTITPNPIANYYNWQGYPAPALLNYYPDFTAGTFTGQLQATWQVTGDADYVLYGGEFLTVNGVPQQGLARMAVSTLAPNKKGPRLTGAATQPIAVSKASGSVQLSWPTNWDPDNETLTYSVYRDAATTPVFTTSSQATSWQPSRISMTNTGLVPGHIYAYKVVVRDAFGNSVTSPTVQVGVVGNSAGLLSSYAKQILRDGAAGYWRLGETINHAQDWTGYADSYVGTGVVRAVPGALSGDPNRAARFTGAATSRVYGSRAMVGPNRFSVEAWFRTTSTSGGKIVGFGNNSTIDSTKYDRHVYMGADGRLRFGVHPNSVRVITAPVAYNDGQWHHLVATLGTSGMRLYVDGALRAADPNTVSASQIPAGYWRIGGDSVGAWPGAAGENFVGDIDDVAVYGRALTAATVAGHQSLGSGGVLPNLAPTATFTAIGGELTASVDASATSDPDGTVESYAWTFGDGATGTGVTASHDYTTPGTKEVDLTVTDDKGGQTVTSQRVVVLRANARPTASFTVTPTDLSATADAAATTDPDGTIASYAWTFGDGATGAGVSASHAYATAGTYPVTLTVTDNDGGITTIAHDVVVAAPNALPTASFTATGGSLTASVDGSGSSDPDGTIAAYAWTFGDDGTGTGPTATHTYATGGTYPVTLTVTDDAAATGSITHDVVVAGPN
ncbi:PKD domain-containing protein [Pengzhenrongella sp.]|jgi:PKD repeat protein|uniref:PKD domain-containing protein n=1 Tax=Pengzhenrongella sp. TaxID=2888820 RepID=UPI002F9486AE